MPIVTRAYEHTAHTGPDLIGTGATRVLAAAGWLGSAVGYTVAAVALSKSYRHITTENWRGRARRDRLAAAADGLVVRDGLPGLGGVVDAGGDQRPPCRAAGFVAVATAVRLSVRSERLPLPARSTSPEYDLWFVAGAVVLGLHRSRRRVVVAAQFGQADRRRRLPVHQADVVPAGLARLPDRSPRWCCPRRASTTRPGSPCWWRST